MGFFDSDVARAGLGWSTGGLSELYRAMQGGSRGYAALPFDNGANRTVDNSRIAQEFQSAVGRAPTQDEIDMYSKYLSTGDLEYGDIGQILRGMPEAGKSRLEDYTQQYADKLGGYDKQYLGNALDQIGAKVNSQFASLGRPNSSAMGAQVFGQGGAIANNLALSRQRSLADFYGRGLQNIQGLYEDQGTRALSRAYQTSDSRTAYNRSLMGYETQRNDSATDLYNENARRRREALFQVPLAIGGAAIGGSMGGPGGAYVGSQIGAKAGGLFGS